MAQWWTVEGAVFFSFFLFSFFFFFFLFFFDENTAHSEVDSSIFFGFFPRGDLVGPCRWRWRSRLSHRLLTRPPCLQPVRPPSFPQ